MPAALIPAVIGAAGAVGGAVIGSNAQKSAAKTAASTAAANNALQEKIYGENTANLTPFMQSGVGATGSIDALLGINPGGGPGGPGGPAGGGAAGAGGALNVNQGQANDAFNRYLNSTGYQFQMNQGTRAVDQSAVGKGALNSGATLKALTQYGQGMGASAFQTYLGNLMQQQQTGLSAANAVAGVGTNFANAVGSNNNASANARGAAAIQQGNLWSGALSSVGNVASNAFGQSSFSGQGAAPNPGALSTEPMQFNSALSTPSVGSLSQTSVPNLTIGG